jgi:hypothetical protein
VQEHRGSPIDNLQSSWGYHCSPGLFLAAASLSDVSFSLDSIVGDESCSFRNIVNSVLDKKLISDDRCFEIGGTFLNQVEPHANRCYDATFDRQQMLSLDLDLKTADLFPRDLRLVIANAVFEQSSGIVATLQSGPSTLREFQDCFSSAHAAPEFQRWRAEQSAIASFELMAWSRNRIRIGGYLVASNILSPATVPTNEEAQFLGLEKLGQLYDFEVRQQTGISLTSAVQVYEAIEPRCLNPLKRVIREVDQKSKSPVWLTTSYEWRWNADKIVRCRLS